MKDCYRHRGRGGGHPGGHREHGGAHPGAHRDRSIPQHALP